MQPKLWFYGCILSFTFFLRVSIYDNLCSCYLYLKLLCLLLFSRHFLSPPPMLQLLPPPISLNLLSSHRGPLRENSLQGQIPPTWLSYLLSSYNVHGSKVGPRVWERVPFKYYYLWSLHNLGQAPLVAERLQGKRPDGFLAFPATSGVILGKSFWFKL